VVGIALGVGVVVAAGFGAKRLLGR
jgi:hypothetical protein